MIHVNIHMNYYYNNINLFIYKRLLRLKTVGRQTLQFLFAAIYIFIFYCYFYLFLNVNEIITFTKQRNMIWKTEFSLNQLRTNGPKANKSANVLYRIVVSIYIVDCIIKLHVWYFNIIVYFIFITRVFFYTRPGRSGLTSRQNTTIQHKKLSTNKFKKKKWHVFK